MYDTLIKGGAIVDGTGGPRQQLDPAIREGEIVAIEPCIKEGAREIAVVGGLIVTPGFVDIHSHYDSQITWDTRLEPRGQCRSFDSGSRYRKYALVHAPFQNHFNQELHLVNRQTYKTRRSAALAA